MHALAAVRREVRARDSATHSKYLKEFTDAFRDYQRALTAQEFDDRITQSSLALVGDYHSLAASQKFASSLIEKQALRRRVVVGAEALLSRDQKIVDAWWRREIGEAEFRRQIRFDREWGYEWAPFYELLVTARDHSEGIYALDCEPRHDLRRIRSRDRHAAAKICQMRKEHPQALVIVLFGESHMAPQHLPRVLAQELSEERFLVVLQNLDALYWRAVGEQATTVSVNENALCVFNSTPLEKYESYRLSLERWNAAEDELPDFTPAVYNVIFSLARSLGFALNSSHNGTQPRFLADSLPAVITVEAQSCLEVADEVRVRLEACGCAYVPEENAFLVRQFEMPQVAHEATRFLAHACRNLQPASAQVEPAENLLASFGARLLCPAAGATGGSSASDALYNDYVQGRVTKAAIRRMFLAPQHELLAAYLGPEFRVQLPGI